MADAIADLPITDPDAVARHAVARARPDRSSAGRRSIGHRRGAAVAGRDPYAPDALVARQAPGERMLARPEPRTRTSMPRARAGGRLRDGAGQLGQARRGPAQLVQPRLVGAEVASASAACASRTGAGPRRRGRGDVLGSSTGVPCRATRSGNSAGSGSSAGGGSGLAQELARRPSSTSSAKATRSLVDHDHAARTRGWGARGLEEDGLDVETRRRRWAHEQVAADDARAGPIPEAELRR